MHAHARGSPIGPPNAQYPFGTLAGHRARSAVARAACPMALAILGGRMAARRAHSPRYAPLPRPRLVLARTLQAVWCALCEGLRTHSMHTALRTLLIVIHVPMQQPTHCS